MKTPVIIAARNEAQYIGATLACLDASSVEPYVIVNDTDDGTADIARDYGAWVRVYESDEPGKIPAIQYGLRELSRQALDEVLYLDADTQPRFPKLWANAMIRGLGSSARVGSGLFISSDGPRLERYTMSTFRLANQFKKLAAGEPLISGVNMITRLGDMQRLEALLAVDNYWLGEDLARCDAVASPAEMRSITRPQAMARTSSRYLESPLTLLRMGRKGALAAVHANRYSRSADGTKPYIRQ